MGFTFPAINVDSFTRKPKGSVKDKMECEECGESFIFHGFDEDKILLNICWGYLAELITKEQFMNLMDKVPHSFREIAKIKKDK